MRVVYWSLACLQPEIEAVSKEVFQLARHFKHSWIFGVHPHYRFCYSRKERYIGFHTTFDPLLRVLIPLLEYGCELNHVYGEPCPWIFYKTLRKKPLILTIASERGAPQVDFFTRCRKILVQTATYQHQLLALGVEKAKVEVVYPAVDLTTFRPHTPPRHLTGPPKVLFATAPRTEEEMAGRGVHIVLQAAQQSPDVHYRLLYRPWKSGYTSLQATQKAITASGLANVLLTNEVVADMPAMYRDHHFTVIPYTTSDGGKECPNSLVEGLACGLPVLITSTSPFAYFVEAYQCGIVCDPEPACLVEAIAKGMSQYAQLSANALRAAYENFSEAVFLRKIESIYWHVRNHA